jgi:hypothetical protein
MRIERRAVDRLPRLAELRGPFIQQLEDARATTLEERDDDSAVLWRARLQPREKQTARGPMILLAARRLGQDIVLCASVPGASDAEVEAAARACEDLSP